MMIAESAMIRVDKIDKDTIDIITGLIEQTESDIEKFLKGVQCCIYQ